MAVTLLYVCETMSVRRRLRPLVKTLARVSIDQLNQEGHGIGMLSIVGFDKPVPVLVPHTMPGDVVQTRLVGTQRRSLLGVVDHLINPAPGRVDPQCRHADVCGGCAWQHIAPEKQASIKQDQVNALMLPLHPRSRMDLIPSTENTQVRDKMVYSFRFADIGLFKAKSTILVDLDECTVSPIWFTKALLRTKQWVRTHQVQATVPRKNGQQGLETLCLRDCPSSGDKMAIVTATCALDTAVLQHLVIALSMIEGLSIVFVHKDARRGVPTRYLESVLQGSTTMTERLALTTSASLDEVKEPWNHCDVELDLVLRYDCFMQPNPRMGQVIYSLALHLTRSIWKEEALIYDVCCGIGVIGLAFAKASKCRVVGFEIEQQSVDAAWANAQRNGVADRMTFVQGDVAKTIPEYAPGQTPDLVIFDPPRSGCPSVALEALLMSSPCSILYISCNPITQARDLAPLVEQGYILQTYAPVDQFPHTPHIENLAFLTRP